MAANAIRITDRNVRRPKGGAVSEDRIVRTTVVLPEPLDKNVEAYCAKEGVTKNAAFLQLLSRGLSANGYQPHKTPKVTISY